MVNGRRIEDERERMLKFMIGRKRIYRRNRVRLLRIRTRG